MYQAELITGRDPSDGETKLKLPLGTTIGIQYVDKITGTLKHVPLIESPDLADNSNGNLYVALFEEDDVDFEVVMDNAEPENRDFAWTMELLGKSHPFIQARGTRGVVTALKANGRKFHFVRQSGHYGEALVGTAGMKHGMAHDDAAKMVSRMKFKKLTYSQEQEELIQITVKTAHGESIPLWVATSDTIFEIKLRLHHVGEQPPPDQQRLVRQDRDGLLLQDNFTLAECGIRDQSTLNLSLELRGGGCGASRMNTRNLQDLLSSPESDWTPTDECDDDEPPKKFTKLEGGTERGVICFGDKSDQKLGRARKFVRDRSIYIEPFVIEMRLAPQGWSINDVIQIPPFLEPTHPHVISSHITGLDPPTP